MGMPPVTRTVTVLPAKGHAPGLQGGATRGGTMSLILTTVESEPDSLCAGCASALPAHSASPASAIHAARIHAVADAMAILFLCPAPHSTGFAATACVAGNQNCVS